MRFSCDDSRGTMAMATFSSALRVGIRLNCWNTKPISRERMSVRTLSDRVFERASGEANLARRRRVERAKELEQRGLARSARTLERDRLPARDLQVDAAQGVDRHAALGVGAGHSLQFIERGPRESASVFSSIRACVMSSAFRVEVRHQPRSRSADAGESRAARHPPAAPAMRPPSSAPANAITIVRGWIGAVRWTVRATVADVVCPKRPLTLEAPTARPVLVTLSAGTDRADDQTDHRANGDADHAPDDADAQRLGHDLAHDATARPTDGAQANRSHARAWRHSRASAARR